MTGILQTERLTLRPFQLSDLETTHEYTSDIANTKYMMRLPHRTVQETECFVRLAVTEWAKEAKQFYEFAVLLNGKHIGGVSISLDEAGQMGELGWIIHRSYQGNGYATEAAKAVKAFAIDTLNVNRIVAHCDCRNSASCRVMQKIGLLLERTDGFRRYQESEEAVRELMYAFTAE